MSIKVEVFEGEAEFKTGKVLDVLDQMLGAIKEQTPVGTKQQWLNFALNDLVKKFGFSAPLNCASCEIFETVVNSGSYSEIGKGFELETSG